MKTRLEERGSGEKLEGLPRGDAKDWPSSQLDPEMTWKPPSVTLGIDLPYRGAVQDKKPGLWSHMPRVQVPIWPLTGWVT